MKPIIHLVILCAVLTGCHVQKRLHTSGYHVQFKGKKKSATDDKSEFTRRAKIQEALDETMTIESFNSTEPTFIEQKKSVWLDLDKTNTDKKEIVTQADSCDEIIMKTGEIISGKITEISDTEIRYKRCGMLDGPTIVKKKSEILVIKYANGQTEVIESIERVERPKTHTPKRHFSSGLSIAGFVISLASLLSLILIDSVSYYFFNTLLIFIMLVSALSIVFSAIGMGRAAQQKREAKTDEEYERARKQMNLGVAGLIIGIVVFVFCVALLVL